ncbi:hypothetical protein GGS21DRAFT_427743 [Xylaria nigripes]|nr:hypothetical protein GGS21DRAFT_427743 [Xylaria nigripes]
MFTNFNNQILYPYPTSAEASNQMRHFNPNAPVRKKTYDYGRLYVPEEYNSSLWITGLKPDVTYHDLFNGIRNTGRVKHVHLYEPAANYPDTCAAKLTYFTHAAACNLLAQARKGSFFVQGIQPAVQWNRNRTAEEPAQGRSRVLRIEGPPEIVNQSYLEAFWTTRFY